MMDASLIKNNRKMNLDHLYCHTANDSSGYIRNNTAGSDMATIRKEIKQLKAMLLLHLDLIQQQSDQLMSKDKLLANLRQENEMLKLKVERLDRRAKINNTTKPKEPVPVAEAAEPQQQQQQQPQTELKTKCDILTKISTKLLNNCSLKLNTLSQIVEEGMTSSVICSPEKSDEKSPIVNGMECAMEDVNKDLSIQLDVDQKVAGPINNIIGESNGKFIHKILLQRVSKIGDELKDSRLCSTILGVAEQEDVDVISLNDEEKSSILSIERHDGNQNEVEIRTVVCDSKDPVKVVLETKSKNADEDNSQKPLNQFDVVAELTKVLLGPVVAQDHDHQQQHSLPEQQKTLKRPLAIDNLDYRYAAKRHFPRPKYMTTRQPYRTREWKMDELDMELNRQIIDAGEDCLQTENVNLEIPKWTIKETTSLYCIEGTEDLGDAVFLKRHARLEHHEKKRKKWDVQRIREQRTIERLKRRHCKDETVDPQLNETDSAHSFYPSADNIKFIQITDDLPIQAFGEGIPTIHRSDFTLPWHNHKMHHQQHLKSSVGSDTKSLAVASTSSSSFNIPALCTSIVFAIKKKSNRKTFASGSPATATTSSPSSKGKSTPSTSSSAAKRNRNRR